MDRLWTATCGWYQASLVICRYLGFFFHFYFPHLSLFSVSEMFFPWSSCAHGKKMRKYKRKRREIPEECGW
jgi:hypothetical protein